MATVTHRITTPSTTNGSSYATGAFVPSVDDLLVVAVTASGTVAAGSVTNSAGITFTKIRSALKAASADTLYLFVADSLVASAVSQTCTFASTGDAATGAIVSVVSVAGLTRTGASAVLKSGVQSNGAAAGTPTVSLGSAALTGNPLIGFVGNGTSPATITQPSTWSELTDATGYATPTTGQEVASINSGFTGSSVTWGSTSGTAYGAIVAEFDVRGVNQSLTATRYDNAETIYAHTLTVGAVALTATRYDNSSTFYSALVEQPVNVQDLFATRYDNSSTFYSPALTTGAVTLTASLFTNDNTFYQPSVNRGAVGLTASLYSNTNEFYAVTVVNGAVNLTTSLVPNSNTFYAHSLAVGAVVLAPTLYSNTNTFYAETVTRGAVNLTASLFTNDNTFYQPIVGGISGVQELTASLVTNSNSFYSTSIDAGLVDLTNSLFVNSNAFYAPTVSVGAVTLTLDIYVNSNQFYNGVISTVTAQDLSPSVLFNENLFYRARFMRSMGGVMMDVNKGKNIQLDAGMQVVINTGVTITI